MAKQIIIKPIVTEKTDDLSENRDTYTFVVAKDANKIEIAKAINTLYGVEVKRVNTAIMPGAFTQRSTRSGIQKGRKPSYKKAYITLEEGEEIDFYGEV